MTKIDEHTVVVYSIEELKSVLEETNTYNYIYLGANVTLKTGITIASSKETITIDGTYNDITYTYEDMNSVGSGDTISVRNAKNKKVIVKNMNVIGHNYYGIIYVPENNALQNIVIEYNNITYNGPQITYHPTGLSRYVNCNITIITSYATANEVAECNRIELGGKTTIMHNSTIDSMFWFRGNTDPYFKVLESASITLTSQARELFYGVTNLALTIAENASMSLTTKNGVGYNNYATNYVLIDKSATLSITQTGQNGGYPTWYCNGPFIMNDNSSLHIINQYSNPSTSNYNLYLMTTNASLTWNNPKEVVLYNRNADVIYTNSTIPFQFTFSRINMWNKASDISNAGSIDDKPIYAWYKNLELSNISGTISPTTTVIQSNNYTTEELTHLPNLSNFVIPGKKVISIGTLRLMIGYITDQSTIIQGYTEPNSDVEISYLKTTNQVVSNNDGLFASTLSEPLPIGTVVSFLANKKNSFLYQSKQVEVIYSGELTLDQVPQTIQFILNPISLDPLLCPRDKHIEIIVSDSRIESTNWKLYASIQNNLTSSNSYTLPNALVFINSDNDMIVLSSTPTLIYTGESNNGTIKITKISWNTNKGILFHPTQEPLQNGETYSTTIIWSISE